MVSEKYLKLLDDLNTESYQHRGKTLRDHLIGTYELLKKWECPEYIALAGLFHSIYGTQYFRVKTADLENRSLISEAIGEKAENLAYIFCVTDRRDFYHEAGKKNPILKDLVCDIEIETTPEVIKDLIEIETANTIEQWDLSVPMNARLVSLHKRMFKEGKGHMSDVAEMAFSSMLEKLNPTKWARLRMVFGTL